MNSTDTNNVLNEGLTLSAAKAQDSLTKKVWTTEVRLQIASYPLMHNLSCLALFSSTKAKLTQCGGLRLTYTANGRKMSNSRLK